MHLKEIRNNSKEDIGQVSLGVDSSNAICKTLEDRSNSVKQSNWRYLGPVIIARLISVVAPLLSLVMVYGKIGKKWEWSKIESF